MMSPHSRTGLPRQARDVCCARATCSTPLALQKWPMSTGRPSYDSSAYSSMAAHACFSVGSIAAHVSPAPWLPTNKRELSTCENCSASESPSMRTNASCRPVVCPRPSRSPRSARSAASFRIARGGLRRMKSAWCGSDARSMCSVRAIALRKPKSRSIVCARRRPTPWYGRCPPTSPAAPTRAQSQPDVCFASGMDCVGSCLFLRLLPPLGLLRQPMRRDANADLLKPIARVVKPMDGLTALGPRTRSIESLRARQEASRRKMGTVRSAEDAKEVCHRS
mmetsp:Transcript_21539/g.46353  ORF Transcript_21539/g.46353 Transcript_21539/m.46353 type:complete len:279 (-) Transcript_21539:365-1201(-)